MMLKLCKSSINTFRTSVRSSPKLPIPCLSTFFSQQNKPFTQPSLTNDYINDLTSPNPQINSYMRKLYTYLTSASALGISSAYFLAATVPVGFPSAFLILAGFALEHTATDYIEKTRPITYSYRDAADGLLKYGTKNPWQRKLAFLASSLGYGCIVAAFMGMTPLPASALCLSAVTCLFSKLGHMGYCNLAPKSLFKPSHLLISGLLAGVVGLNLVTSCSAILGFANPLHSHGIELGTYIGLLLYNVFTGHDSQSALEDVHKGKGDDLLHGNKFSENWLYALIPQFLMNLY